MFADYLIGSESVTNAPAPTIKMSCFDHFAVGQRFSNKYNHHHIGSEVSRDVVSARV